MHFKVKETWYRSFLNLLEKPVVHEGDLDTWEFGKGTLSELQFRGVAVQQSCGQEKAKEV
jgi:hypothetical protein